MSANWRDIQAGFAAYLREPERNPPPAGVDPERMAVYRELFFNNIESFINSNFPVLRKIYPEAEWRALAADFYAHHRCQTPYFCEIAREFLDYLQQRRGELPHAFTLELAHYEWVEMALAIAREELPPEQELPAGGLPAALKLSPLAWPLLYQYPVQLISPDYLPSQPPEQPTYLIVYRDRGDEVHFMQATPFTYWLLQSIDAQPGANADAYLGQLAAEAGLAMDAIREHGLDALRQLHAKSIILPASAV